MNRDRTVPDKPWEFDQGVTDVFGDMLKRSIPGHDEMRALVARFAERFMIPGQTVLDVGCSRGDSVAGLVEAHHRENRFVLLETSASMREAARRRFGDRAEVHGHDLTAQGLDLLDVNPDSVCVTLAVLTLQFVNQEGRTRILDQVYRALSPQGALIVVEKTVAEHPRLEEAITSEYYRHKLDRGYSWTEIDRKRLSLDGVMDPWEPWRTEDALHRAGFACARFWSDLCFTAWLCVGR